MAEQETETRIRWKYTGEADSYRHAPNPRAAGEAFREKRDEIMRSGRGGETEIEERHVGPWRGVGGKAVIPAAGEGA